MFKFFSNGRNEVLDVILDIQSGLVRGSVVYGGNQILSVVTKSFSNKTEIANVEHLNKKTFKLISDVLDHISKDVGNRKIGNIRVILSMPWINTKLKTVQVKFESETKVTSSLMAEIIKGELNNDNVKGDSFPIEQKVFEIRLNGYPTLDVEDKYAHLLELSISTSFSPTVFIEKLKALLSKHLNYKEHSFHSGLLLQYSALREIFKDKNEFIYIHIHRELTDMIVIKEGLCRHIATLPFGISTILKKIANNNKESLDTSDSILSLYQGHKLNDAEMGRIDKVITPLMNKWSSDCINSIKNSLDITSIPRTIYLSAHSHFDLFKGAMITSQINFSINQYDSIDIGDKVIYGKGSAESNMMKIYTFALNNML